MGDDHHASALGIVEPREDFSLKQFHHPVETLDVVAIFQLAYYLADERILKRLEKDKLVTTKRGVAALTEAGKTAANAAAGRLNERKLDDRRYPT